MYVKLVALLVIIAAVVGVSFFVMRGVKKAKANPTEAVQKAVTNFNDLKSLRAEGELLATIKLTYEDGTSVSKDSTSKILLSSDLNFRDGEVKARITQAEGEKSTEYQYIYLKSGDMYLKMPTLTKWVGGPVPTVKYKTVLPTTLQTYDFVTVSRAALSSLRTATLEEKGTENIEGRETTRYSADVDPDGISTKLASFEMSQDMVDGYKKSTIKTDLWVDKSGEIKKQLLTVVDYPIVVKLNLPGGKSAGQVKGKENMSVTINYSNFNQNLSISKPAGDIQPVDQFLNTQSQ